MRKRNKNLVNVSISFVVQIDKMQSYWIKQLVLSIFAHTCILLYWTQTLLYKEIIVWMNNKLCIQTAKNEFYLFLRTKDVV